MQGRKIATKYTPLFNPEVNVLEIARTKNGDYMVRFRYKGKITQSLLREDPDGNLYFNAARQRIYYTDLRKVG